MRQCECLRYLFDDEKYIVEVHNLNSLNEKLREECEIMLTLFAYTLENYNRKWYIKLQKMLVVMRKIQLVEMTSTS